MEKITTGGLRMDRLGLGTFRLTGDACRAAAIPKAGRRESQEANLAAWHITLDDDDRARIAALPKTQRRVNPPFAPQWD
jgi:diketogulonate reductase-like aldo/keto reductase